MLSRILQVALGFSNSGSMIALAAGEFVTGAIFRDIKLPSPVCPSVICHQHGQVLMWWAWWFVLLLASVANIFLQMPVLHLVIICRGGTIFLGLHHQRDISSIVRRDQLRDRDPGGVPGRL